MGLFLDFALRTAPWPDELNELGPCIAGFLYRSPTVWIRVLRGGCSCEYVLGLAHSSLWSSMAVYKL